MKRIRCKRCLVTHTVMERQHAERLRCGTPGCGLPFRTGAKDTSSDHRATMIIDPADEAHWLQSGQVVEVIE